MEHVEVHGLRVGFRRAGDGPPLVLLHGAICDSRVWRDQLDELSDEFTVVAWDAPGCGESPDPPETFRLPEYADCLAGMIDALRLGRPHVLGHSFGGGLALELYRRHPDVPASLVLAGAYAGWAGSLPADEVQRRLQLALDLADRLPIPIGLESLPGLVSGAMSPETMADLEAVMAQVRPVGTRVMALAVAEADLRDVLPRVAVPTLLLHGDLDERAPIEVARSLQSGIPASTLVTIPAVGHESYLEAPRRFNAEVRRFLRVAMCAGG